MLEDGIIKNRFYRFASLVPNGKDDQDDGTYMIGGQFTGLTIVKDKNSQSWGISENNIDVAWLVSSSRIEFSYQDDNDYFSIIHKGKKEDYLLGVNNLNFGVLRLICFILLIYL